MIYRDISDVYYENLLNKYLHLEANRQSFLMLRQVADMVTVL
jgi:hypothetical protein